MQNFGQRLKGLISRRELTPEQFWDKFGISRATFFNWVKREKPPPSKRHQRMLVEFFGMSEDYILHGLPQNLDESKTVAPHMLEEPAGSYDSNDVASRLRERIALAHAALLESAGDDLGRLGWYLEELRKLTARASWEEKLDAAAVESSLLAKPRRDAHGSEHGRKSQAS